MKFRIVESLNTEYDSEGNELSLEQVEFFKDSKVRDSQGRLLVCYHGSSKQFDTFKHDRLGSSSDFGYYGDGFYFTDDESVAEEYSKGYIFKVYLNITNPYYIHSIEDDFKFANSINDGVIELLNDDEKKQFEYNGISVDNKQVRQKRKENLKKILSNHDGVIEDIMTQNNGEVHIHDESSNIDIEMNQFVVFNSNQIKSITNKTPTNSDNINEEIKLSNTK